MRTQGGMVRSAAPLTTASTVVAAVFLTGCGSTATDANIVTVEHEGLRVEFMLDRDRVVYAGPVDGPNLVHLDAENMALGPTDDGSYRFFGGGYSWVSPQDDPVLGWRNDAGGLENWPPDPAMDRGPVELARMLGDPEPEGVAAAGFVVVGPAMRTGLIQQKTFSLHERVPAGVPQASLAYVLRNTSDRTVTGGTWFNTAVAGDGFIAVPGPPSARIRVTPPERQGDFDRLIGERRDRWLLLDLSRGVHEGGFKVYFDGPATIAVWHEGVWLRRDSHPGANQALIDAGEGAVAVYTDANAGIHEAELYGPLVDIPAGGETLTVEGWLFHEGPPTLGGLLGD